MAPNPFLCSISGLESVCNFAAVMYFRSALLRPAQLISPPDRFLSLSAPGSKRPCEWPKTGSAVGGPPEPQEAAGLSTSWRAVRGN